MSDDDLENDDLEVGDDEEGDEALETAADPSKRRPTTVPKMPATTTAVRRRRPRANPRPLSR